MTSKLNFDLGLAMLERLEVMIESPYLRLLAPSLPMHGWATRPAAADPSVLLVVGVATVICGSDRRADAELRCHWPRLRAAFLAAGYPAPAEPVLSSHFRYYRDSVLGGAMPDAFRVECREMAVGQVLAMDQMPAVDSPWLQPLAEQTVVADGTWMKAASEVRSRRDSRAAKGGTPRILDDVSRRNKEKAWGYNMCIRSTRGSAARQRIILDVVREVGGKELDVVVPAVLRLREQLGDRFRCLVYDGAMRGVHNRELRAAGLVTMNKPRGIRERDQWERFRGMRLGQSQAVFELPTGCVDRHLLNVSAGMMWELSRTPVGGFQRLRALEVVGLERHRNVDGTYRWEMRLTIRCRHGDHTVVIDPNVKKIPAVSVKTLMAKPSAKTRGKAKVNLSDDLRLAQVNEDYFWNVYGRRNDAEGTNKNLKSDYGLGHRARSYTAERLEFDMWLLVMLTNTLAWKEHIQEGRHLRTAA